jgi:hypothetical protein
LSDSTALWVKKIHRDVFVFCDFHFVQSDVTRVVKSLPVMFMCFARFDLAIQSCAGSKKSTRDVRVLCHSYFQRSHVTRVVKSIPAMFVCFARFYFSDPKLRSLEKIYP